MRCFLCGEVADTDADPDGWYTIEHPQEFCCQWCRDDRKLHSQFDHPNIGAKYDEGF